MGLRAILLMKAVSLPALALLAATAAAQGRLVSVPLDIPVSLRSGTFATPRNLNVPPGWTASLLGVHGGARFAVVAPNGDLLVTNSGTVRRYVPGPPGTAAAVNTFVSGLNTGHDLVFTRIGTQWWLYVGEKNRIRRARWNPGDTVAGTWENVVTGLPDNSLPELGGAYGHVLKNIAIDGNTLYLSIASASNANVADRQGDPIRCAIYAYNLDGTNRRLVANGVRNAEGLAIEPGTNNLWLAVNNRDQTRYPYQTGPFGFGELNAAYVDDHPPDELIRVANGADYGWPYANPSPDSLNGMDFMPFDPDYDNNRLWANFPESTFARVAKGIQAHSAALGITFFGDKPVVPSLRQGVAIALHGSWNRRQKTGYKVVWFPWFAPASVPLGQQDLVTGFLNPDGNSSWDRPVDVAVLNDGSVIVTGDQAGGVYRLVPPADAVGGHLGVTSRPRSAPEDFRRFSGPYRTWPARTGRGETVSDYSFIGPGTVEAPARGMRTAGQGTGFALRIDADPQPRTLVLDVDSSAGGRLELRLSDGSAPTYVTKQPAGRRRIEVGFRAVRPGTTLHAIWTADGAGDAVITSASVTGGRRR